MGKRKATRKRKMGGKGGLNVGHLKKTITKMKPVAKFVLKEVALPIARDMIKAKLRGKGLKHAGGGLYKSGSKGGALRTAGARRRGGRRKTRK
jgi:hypothetical protein